MRACVRAIWGFFVDTGLSYICRQLQALEDDLASLADAKQQIEDVTRTHAPAPFPLLRHSTSHTARES